MNKPLGNLCLRYDILGSKPSLISFKKFFFYKLKEMVLYKSESLGQRGEVGGGGVAQLNNRLTVPVLPELLSEC